jgi:hypothetical protein
LSADVARKVDSQLSPRQKFVRDDSSRQQIPTYLDEARRSFSRADDSLFLKMTEG